LVASSTTPVALSVAACLMFAKAVAVLATSDRLLVASRSPPPVSVAQTGLAPAPCVLRNCPFVPGESFARFEPL
jgi:hypothetical protein